MMKTSAMTLAVGFAVLSLALALSACDSGGKTGDTATTKKAVTAIDTSLPGDPVAGKKVYDKVCMACHAADGKGNGGITGGNFVGEPERLNQDNALLIKQILEGKKTPGKTVFMPPQKTILSEQEVKDALSFVRQSFGKK